MRTIPAGIILEIIIGNITKVGRYLEYHSIIYLICYQDAQV